MALSDRSRQIGWVIVVATTLAWLTPARGQAPPTPSPSPPATVADPAVEERLRKQDESIREQRAMIQQLIDQNKALSRQVELMAGGTAPAPSVGGQPPRSDRSDEGGAGARDNPAQTASRVGTSTGDGQPPRSDRSSEGGAGARDNPAQTEPRIDKPGPSKIRANVSLGPGWLLESDDGEYQLQIHNQTQVEYRGYQQGGMKPSGSGFYSPRERIIFSGRLTKLLEYEGSVEAAYGAINLLNAFLNIHVDDRFMIKFGRYKAPFLYEYYGISNVDLLQPERSLYGTNFGLNRELGAMIWGQLFEKRIDYAVGAFDGSRNTQINLGNDKDVIGYVNAKPFLKNEDWKFLRYLNIGGSIDYGQESSTVIPQALRTSVSQSTNVNLANVAPAWFTFNNGVTESGSRELLSLHSSYFYKSLSVIGEWQGGYTDYSVGSNPARFHIPINGYYVAAGYFLTGEEVDRRSQVKPKKAFNLRSGKFGLGAVELQARYSQLTLGSQVFTAGLADPNQWSNQARMTDVGVNWYLNEYVKLYFDWQHSTFGQPVIYAPGKYQLTSDLFWVRAQVYF